MSATLPLKMLQNHRDTYLSTIKACVSEIEVLQVRLKAAEEAAVMYADAIKSLEEKDKEQV